jgi:hypothetical protein
MCVRGSLRPALRGTKPPNQHVLAPFSAAAILTALFVVQERRAQQQMLPLSLFTNRVFARTTLVATRPCSCTMPGAAHSIVRLVEGVVPAV